MYTPRGELDERILELLNREDVCRRIIGCRNGREIRDVLEEFFPIDPDTLEESLAVICSYLTEMRRSEVLGGGGLVPLSAAELSSVTGGTASGESRVLAALADLQRQRPESLDNAATLLMKLQKM